MRGGSRLVQLNLVVVVVITIINIFGSLQTIATVSATSTSSSVSTGTMNKSMRTAFVLSRPSRGVLATSITNTITDRGVKQWQYRSLRLSIDMDRRCCSGLVRRLLPTTVAPTQLAFQTGQGWHSDSRGDMRQRGDVTQTHVAGLAGTYDDINDKTQNGLDQDEYSNIDEDEEDHNDEDERTIVTDGTINRNKGKDKRMPTGTLSMMHSRAPFQMPPNSPDDSIYSSVELGDDSKAAPTHHATKHSYTADSTSQRAVDTTTKKVSTATNKKTPTPVSWTNLGLWPILANHLAHELQFKQPTPVQSMAIPAVLKQHPSMHHICFLAATGSGKTLAYVLPLMQMIKQVEYDSFGFPEQDPTTSSTPLASTSPKPAIVTSFVSSTAADTESRPKQRPRLLILAPTRELVQQIGLVVKQVCHILKLSSTALYGSGNNYRKQKESLNRPIDIIVSTPSRLLQHWKDGNVFLSQVQHIVLDEMDTMLEQGFAKELADLIHPLLYPRLSEGGKQGTNSSKIPLVSGSNNEGLGGSTAVLSNSPRIIMTSATMTQAIIQMIADAKESNQIAKDITAKKLYRNKNVTTDTGGSSSLVSQLRLPRMILLKAEGLHKAIPRLKQIFVDVGNADKMDLLVDLLVSSTSSWRKGLTSKRTRKRQTNEDDWDNDGQSDDDSLDLDYASHDEYEDEDYDIGMASGSSSLSSKLDSSTSTSDPAIMVFCNTGTSCRAVQYACAEARIDTLAYHGGLNSNVRQQNWKEFQSRGGILICTDLAARGLDILSVDHVVLFDFPLNSLDYLHRTGRTARQGRSGRVTAFVTKRDQVLAKAIERAVRRGEPLDGLSSRKSDYTKTQQQLGQTRNPVQGRDSRRTRGLQSGKVGSRTRESPSEGQNRKRSQEWKATSVRSGRSGGNTRTVPQKTNRSKQKYR